MISHRILEGDFVRADLYFGRLTVVTYSGGVNRYNIPNLSSPKDLDNEGIQTFAEQWAQPVGLATGRKLELRPPSNSEILSLHSYDGATFLGAEDGLWAMPESAASESVRPIEYAHLAKRPALDVDTAFGVAVVAHGDGVSVVPLNSSWLAEEYFKPSSGESDANLQAVTWTHHDIVGRSAPFVFEAIPGDFELRSLNESRHYVFQGLGQATSLGIPDDDLLTCAVAPRSFAAWNRVENRSTLYERPQGGWLGKRSDEVLQPGPESPLRELGNVSGRVISLQELGKYLICELSDRLSVIDRTGTESVLLNRAATDVRVYPRSRRYRSIVTAISEWGVHVVDLGR